MIVGFKTGPKSWDEGKQIVEETGAKMCEVWARHDEMSQYAKPIKWLQDHGVRIGLHYWGMVEGGLLANVATNHRGVFKASLKQMREMIDWAGDLGAVYVNIHPGHRHLDKVVFEPILRFDMVPGEATEQSEAEKIMLAAGLELTEYAKTKGTIVTVETITRFMQHTPGRDAREDIYDSGPMDLSVIKQLAAAGVFIANDITHSAAWLAPADGDKQKMWQDLLAFTDDIKDRTRLIHVNTVRPPFNGTDSHDGIKDEDFARDVFPDKAQMKELLATFKDRDDVYAVLEPREDMRGNYQALVEMERTLRD